MYNPYDPQRPPGTRLPTSGGSRRGSEAPRPKPSTFNPIDYPIPPPSNFSYSQGTSAGVSGLPKFPTSSLSPTTEAFLQSVAGGPTHSRERRVSMSSSSAGGGFRGTLPQRRLSMSSGTGGFLGGSGRGVPPFLPPASTLHAGQPTCLHFFTNTELLDKLESIRNIFGRTVDGTPSPPSASRSAGGVIVDFYKKYYTLLNKDPDERGLTDQFIASILEQTLFKPLSPASNFHDFRLRVRTCSQKEEAQLGWDFEVSLNLPGGCNKYRHYCLVQAKTLKDPNPESMSARLYVNLAQKAGSSSRTQLEVLRNEVATRRAESRGYVVGGYLIYSDKLIWYFPIEDIPDESYGTLANRFIAAHNVRKWGADGILKHIVAEHVRLKWK